MYNKSDNIRVPSNTHPNHLNYGDTLHPQSLLLEEDEDGDLFYSAYGTPASRPQSIRNSIRNFAGSYSRASVLYTADMISSAAPSIVENDEEGQLLFKAKTTDEASSSVMDNTNLYKTFSQRTTDCVPGGIIYHGDFEPLSRHTTVASIISRQLSHIPIIEDSQKQHLIQQHIPKSSFIQTVFNSVNVLVGVGILALPLSFRLAGWLYGSFIFLFCCIGTNYTAKIIVKCINANKENGEGTYGDMGQVAFGDKGRSLIGTVFIIELITMGVAMIVLLGDGIQSLYPELDLVTTRAISFCVLTPTVFLPIKKLAYTSLIGIIGCISLVIIVSYDGLSKKNQPGSLYDPMSTEIVPSDISSLPLSFGLIMSGFAGHAVFPSIYRDMGNPKQYNHMVNVTYIITAVIYSFMAIVGYLMFGQDTLQEITQNLALIDEYNKSLNHFAIWLLVLTPVAKYGLMLHPLNLSWELALFSRPKVETWLKLDHHISWRKNLLTIVGRIFVTAALVYIALIFPGFDKVMSLLGAFFSFTISIIFPLICHLQLFKTKLSVTETLFNWVLLMIAIIMAVFGTIWSLYPSEEL